MTRFPASALRWVTAAAVFAMIGLVATLPVPARARVLRWCRNRRPVVRPCLSASAVHCYPPPWDIRRRRQFFIHHRKRTHLSRSLARRAGNPATPVRTYVRWIALPRPAHPATAWGMAGKKVWGRAS